MEVSNVLGKVELKHMISANQNYILIIKFTKNHQSAEHLSYLLRRTRTSELLLHVKTTNIFIM